MLQPILILFTFIFSLQVRAQVCSLGVKSFESNISSFLNQSGKNQSVKAYLKTVQASSSDTKTLKLVESLNQKMENGLSLKLSPNGDLLFDDGRLALKASQLDKAKVTTELSSPAIKPRSLKDSASPGLAPASEDLERLRRQLVMTPKEKKFLAALDLKQAKRIKSQRLNRPVLCGKTKKNLKVWRREKSPEAIKKLNRPKSFSYHSGIPNSRTVDRHLSGSGPENYMGVATVMDSNTSIAGNGGKFLKALCLPIGMPICIIGGAESELVLMNSAWKPCP